MRKETTKNTIDIVEALNNGEWAVRWDFKPKYNEQGETTEVNWYEEEIFNHIPQLEEIKETITNWFNKQVDGAILQGFKYNSMPVWLSMENQFNYKSIFDLSIMIEQKIAAWDEANPSLAGQTYIIEEVTSEDGTIEEISKPTGRPQSLFPVNFKFGTNEQPNYHTFNNIEELTDFYTATLSYIQGCYTSGWIKKDSFDYSQYEKAIAAL